MKEKGRRQPRFPALLSAWGPHLLSMEDGILPTKPSGCAHIPPRLVALAAPRSDGRKVRDGVLETLVITSWVTAETSQFGADTFLNIAQGRTNIPFVTKATYLPTQTGLHANRSHL